MAGYNQPFIAKKRKSKGIRTKKQLRRLRGEVESKRKVSSGVFVEIRQLERGK